MMQLLLATNNRGKLSEMLSLLDGLPWRSVTPEMWELLWMLQRQAIPMKKTHH